MTLAKPDFIVNAPDGTIQAMFCKVCGDQIGGMSEVAGHRLIGGKSIQVLRMKFIRFQNFTEMKLLMRLKNEEEDSGRRAAHITIGCSRCMTTRVGLRLMQQIYDADMEEQRPDMPPQVFAYMNLWRPVEVIGIKVGGGMT